jgi:hypothetical protein
MGDDIATGQFRRTRPLQISYEGMDVEADKGVPSMQTREGNVFCGTHVESLSASQLPLLHMK